jgi:CelD/BcsL family acetyltransferase involved in cellulose biosynthesis
VAIDDMMSCAIDSGLSHFDFTIGNETYKRQFGTTAGVLYDGLYPLSAKGRVVALGKAAARRARSTATRNAAILKARFKAGLNRIFEVRGAQGSP